MKVGIIGGGNLGSRLAALFMAAGHDVVVGTRADPGSISGAARHGEIVVVAIHFRAVAGALPALAEELRGKIVVDATNPLNDDWSPLPLGDQKSAGETIAGLLPFSKVVKAFNSIFADVMTPDGMVRDGHAITAFVASDDRAAADKVADLARASGFAPVTIATLRAARYLEAMAHLNIELAVGQSGGTNAAFVYDRR